MAESFYPVLVRQGHRHHLCYNKTFFNGPDGYRNEKAFKATPKGWDERRYETREEADKAAKAHNGWSRYYESTSIKVSPLPPNTGDNLNPGDEWACTRKWSHEPTTFTADSEDTWKYRVVRVGSVWVWYIWEEYTTQTDLRRDGVRTTRKCRSHPSKMRIVDFIAKINRPNHIKTA